MSRSILFDHFIVIALFVILTIIFTFPAILNFDQILGGIVDTPYRIQNFWWYNYSITELGIHPFYSDYAMYPEGISSTTSTIYNALVSVFLQQFFDVFTSYNILIFSTFVLAGYFTFHLSKYITKNYFISVIAGIIFSFSSYQLAQSANHISESTIQWIPLVFLFLLKSQNSSKIRYPIFMGISLFLVFLSSLYLFFFSLVFLVIFVIVQICKDRPIKKSIKNFFIFSISFLVLSIPIGYVYVLPMLGNAGLGPLGFPIDIFNVYSIDITNFLRIPPENYLSNFVDSSWISVGVRDSWAFIGFVSIPLIVIAVFKEKKWKTPWLISGLVFAIIGMGPLLKINGITTEIPLPLYYLLEIQYLDVFKSIGRASVMVFLSISILTALGLNFILTKKIFSYKKKLIFLAVIGLLVIFQFFPTTFSHIHYPEISDIYYQISNDPRKVAVLEAPLGGMPGQNHLASDQFYWYYQTVHSKPSYAMMGIRVYPEPDVPTKLENYFLNQFLMPQRIESDVINQDLAKFGIPILNHFNIGYVIVHKNSESPIPNYLQEQRDDFVLKMRKMLRDIFSKEPDFEDSKLFAYKVPDDFYNEKPFLVLGKGWSPILTDGTRAMYQDSTLIIINPNDEPIQTELELQLSGIMQTDQSVQISLRNFTLNENIQKNSLFKYTTGSLQLQPGANKIKFHANESIEILPTYDWQIHPKVSFSVYQISLNSDSNIVGRSVDFLDNIDSTKSRILVESKVTEFYKNILHRLPEQGGLKGHSDLIQKGESFESIQKALEGSEEGLEKKTKVMMKEKRVEEMKELLPILLVIIILLVISIGIVLFYMKKLKNSKILNAK